MTPRYNALALVVACPQCDAPVAVECMGQRGVRIKGTHWMRRQAARRHRFEVQKAKGLLVRYG